MLTRYLDRIHFHRAVIDPDTAPYIRFLYSYRLEDRPLTSELLLDSPEPGIGITERRLIGIRSLSFRRKTLDLANDRVSDLCSRFREYVTRFDCEGLFTGPSLYFHQRTLAIRGHHLGAIDRCLQNDIFFESLYATLTAWGLHRMGTGKTKLVDLPVLRAGIQKVADRLRELEGFRIVQVGPGNFAHTLELVWNVVSELQVGIGSTRIVAGTKALHHLLPDLVPPIDRAYTVQFFFNNKNAIQGDESRQYEAFRLMYSHVVAICHNNRREIKSRIGSHMNTSFTKVVDNAIVGYCRSVLRIRDNETAGQNLS